MIYEDLLGLVPAALAPKTRKIFLRGYELPIDIGFHDFEVGAPQRVVVDIEVRVDADHFPTTDSAADAWDYDVLRNSIAELVATRRYNLQETLARAIYDMIAARRGVTGVRVSTRKPDIYPDCDSVGVELSSF